MFGISGTELVLVIVFVLIIFGPDKLPELARTIGKAMRAFKGAQEDMERLIKAEMYLADKAPDAAAETGPTKAEATSQAAAIWEATESDDEEEEEE